jgi:hypothetical protein
MHGVFCVSMEYATSGSMGKGGNTCIAPPLVDRHGFGANPVAFADLSCLADD